MKVSWDESVCIHAGKCVQGAPEVFKIEDGKFVIDTSASSEDKLLTLFQNVLLAL